MTPVRRFSGSYSVAEGTNDTIDNDPDSILAKMSCPPEGSSQDARDDVGDGASRTEDIKFFEMERRGRDLWNGQ